MIITQNNNQRLAIFFFYDKDGIVDDYILYLLNDIERNVDEIMIVCNGALTPEGRHKFLQITDKIIVRENVGFDVWAYKTAIDYYGYDKLALYDEVVFFNFTIFGPLYPFSEMFAKMDAVDIDFWGITAYGKVNFDPFGTIKYGYIPKHIQSHFIVVRKSMLSSIEFKKYWDNMQPINSYQEAVGCHEAIFTKDFEDKGFKSCVYIDTTDLEDIAIYPLMMIPTTLVKDRRCPIIKRKSFFHDLSDYLNHTTNEQSIDLLKFIKNNLLYDTNLIWHNILRCENQALIKRNLNLNYVLSSDNSKILNVKDKKIALVMHIYFMDLVDYCLHYASSMPSNADIYITTNSEENKLIIEHSFIKLKCNKLDVVVIENRGRDVSALLVATKAFIDEYDYVCFAHDKKTAQVNPGSAGQSFSYKCFENVLCSKSFVLNVINTFDDNPRLGLLTPPPPNNGVFFPTIGFEWGPNFASTKELADKIGLNVDIRESLEPIAPLGTMFWFRPKALKALFDMDWKYSDFPLEPNYCNGTLLHAVERIYPYVVQHEGFYPAWLLTDSFASIEITNLHYMLRELSVIGMKSRGLSDFNTLKNNLKFGKDFDEVKFYSVFKYKLKNKLKYYLPDFMLCLLKKIRNVIKY